MKFFQTSLAWSAALILATLPGLAQAAGKHPTYQLYINQESYGVVVFPKSAVFRQLDAYLESLGFEPVASGEAVMRFGGKKENMTYMMPPEVQEKFRIEKFVILQILGGQAGIMVGIFEQHFGLTLPPKIFDFDAIKLNLPKTLDQFRRLDERQKTKNEFTRPEKPGAASRSGLNNGGDPSHADL